MQIKYQPIGTIFPLYHTNSDFDYNAYLAVILQGKNGQWLMTNPFSHETFNPTVFYIFYIFIGKLAAIFRLSPHVAYHIIRNIGVLLYISGIYVLATKLLGKKKGFWASIFAIIATISPLPLFQEPEGFVNYLPWWYNLEALKRLDQMPHYMWSAAILFFVSRSLIDLVKKERTLLLLSTLVALFIAGIIFPPMMLPIIFALPLGFGYTHIFKWIKTRTINIKKHQVLTVALMVGIVAVAYLVIMRERTNGFPWDTWNDWERARWSAVTAFERKLLVAFGIMPILALPGAISFLLNPTIVTSYISFWAYLPYILLPFINIIGLSNFRVTTLAPFIPLSILTAKTAFMVKDYFSTLLRQAQNRSKSNIVRAKSRTFLSFLLQHSIFLLVILTSIPVTITIIPKVHHITMVSKIKTRFMHFFVPQADWDALLWLRDNTNKDDVVVSNRYLGNLVPAHAYVKSYLGHHVHTKDFFSKELFVDRFFSGAMTEQQANTFFTQGNVTYIFFALSEVLKYPPPTYSSLEVVYKTPGSVIYKVTNQKNSE